MSSEPLVSLNKQNYALQVERLCKTFYLPLSKKSITAAADVSFAVESGTIFGLLGPNGSGKSTCMKIILGLVAADSGRAEIFGKPSIRRQARAQVGFLPENPYFYKHLSGYETVEFFAKLSGMTSKIKPQIDEVLELVGLENAATQRLGSYFKGMLQRIALAQALIHQPPILVLDEPTAGVDPQGSRLIRDIILRLKNQGKTILLCSHLLEQVQEICDNIAIMHHGKIITQGSTSTLLAEQNQRQLVLQNASAELLAQIRQLCEKSPDCQIISDNKAAKSLETFFLDQTS